MQEDIKGLYAGQENMYDKIATLIDARLVTLDNFKDNDSNFKSIRRTLKNHSFRISVLESKAN